MKLRRPLFFVISGAHGVGKTTAVEACHELFSGQGIPLRKFHHIIDGVPSKPAAGAAIVDGMPPTRRSMFYWGRFVPRPLKMLAASVRDGLLYVSGINRILVQAGARGQIALSDRYVYDRMVDLRLHRRPLTQRAVLFVMCCFMRRPTVTILLTDSPTAIHHRKQEQTEDQIDQYQRGFVDLCNRVRAPLLILPVNGITPDTVTRHLAAIILKKARALGYPISSTAVAARLEQRVGHTSGLVVGES